MPPASSAPPIDWKSLDALIARVDEDRWISSRYAPERQRQALIALYALNYELARIRLVASEPTLLAIRFQWWREELGAMDAPCTEPRHVVASALKPLVGAGVFSGADLLELADRHQDAAEAQDRTLEPEGQLARLAAGVLAPDWPFDGAIDVVVGHFAAARRGEPVKAFPGEVGTGSPSGSASRQGLEAARWFHLRMRRYSSGHAPVRAPSSVLPALAHLALRHSYRGARSPSAFRKRFIVLGAMVTGRL